MRYGPVRVGKLPLRMPGKLRILAIALGSILALIVIVVLGFVIWASRPLGPDGRALEALQDGPDLAVQRTDDSWLLFGHVADVYAGRVGWNGGSASARERTGIVFYPGGLVDHRSYAAFARLLATEGYSVVIVPAPLNLMVFAPDRALEVITRFSSIDRWVIAGHSLGAAMATNFVRRNPQLSRSGQLRAMVLLAGYPAEGWDLSSDPVSVLSISAEYDEVFNRESFENTVGLLPPDTVFSTIDRGNHAGFGDYGLQRGDGTARISTAEQQRVTVERIVDFLDRVLEF
ncbi:MAG: alpha/beta hydrolase [Spirochaetaceae bacterium]|nr:MAG: alpha/beta hydrolase [Spirochaetaceae bacterium]